MPIAFLVPPAFSRPTWTEIDLPALVHNLGVLADRVYPAGILAVIKADAYGHGAVEVARALEMDSRVTALGVASVDEGALLRQGLIKKPILLLSAVLPEEAEAIVEFGLMPTLWTIDLARSLQFSAVKQKRTVTAHFKVDTGMGRLGVSHEAALDRWKKIQEFDRLVHGGIYTHLACAGEAEEDFTPRQLHHFATVLKQIEPGSSVVRHAANSAAILRYPNSWWDMVRPGLALYGVSPFEGETQVFSVEGQLRPVMSWYSRITSLKLLEQGQGVSYGNTWVAPHRSVVATVAVGYADGYPRALSNKGEVLVGGQKCPVRGRVTMDQIIIEVGHLTVPARVGDQVTLLGKDHLVTEVAERAGTIGWEILSCVSRRVPRITISAAPTGGGGITM